MRGVAFAVIFIFNLVFIALGSLGLLPLAAHITAVSLGGVAIGVMAVFNIIGDVAIASRMYSAPGAYLLALTPAPRWQILLSSVITMLILDVVTMAIVITGEVLLAFNMIGASVRSVIIDGIGTGVVGFINSLPHFALTVAGYLLIVMIIMFCISVDKSVFYQKRAGGLMTAVVAIVTVYIVSVSPLLLAPFGTVTRYSGVFFMVTIGTVGIIMYALLNLILAAALFVMTSRLMERKMNI